jgi:hypothetical protein
VGILPALIMQVICGTAYASILMEYEDDYAVLNEHLLQQGKPPQRSVLLWDGG